MERFRDGNKVSHTTHIYRTFLPFLPAVSPSFHVPSGSHSLTSRSVSLYFLEDDTRYPLEFTARYTYSDDKAFLDAGSDILLDIERVSSKRGGRVCRKISWQYRYGRRIALSRFPALRSCSRDDEIIFGGSSCGERPISGRLC